MDNEGSGDAEEVKPVGATEDVGLEESLAEEDTEANDVDDESNIAAHVGTNEQREARRLEHKPNIDHLMPGVVDCKPVFKPGDRIVVERHISFVPGNPWLDTSVYQVLSINEVTGECRVYHEDYHHFAMVSYISPHQLIKLAPARGPAWHRMHRKTKLKKTGWVPPEKNDAALEPSATRKRKPRRPKSVIEAEKKERSKKRAEKRILRQQKKAMIKEKREQEREARKNRGTDT